MKKMTLPCIVLLMGALLLCGAGRAGNCDLPLGAASTAQGLTSTLDNPGPSSYLKLSSVDPSINRMRIVDDRNRVYFDGHPDAGRTILLPQGRYSATLWSACGSAPIVYLHCLFVNAPAVTPAAHASPGTMVSHPDGATEGTTHSGGYPATYNNRYNNYNRRPYQKMSPLPSPKPTSILDPNYHQNSIFTSPAPKPTAKPSPRPSCRPTPGPSCHRK